MSDDDKISSIFPKRWVLPLWGQAYQQEVFVRWLDQELPGKPSEADHLSGWRYREVYEYVSGPNSYDWTARMYSSCQ